MHDLSRCKTPNQGEPSLSERVLVEIPRLRTFARLMTNDASSADRAVTETLKYALHHIERLGACKDLQIHLFIILRAILVKCEAELQVSFWIENGHLERPISLATGLLSLPFEGREAVVLRAGLRLSRMTAAIIIGCEPHIYDARVLKGLIRLAELLPQVALDGAIDVGGGQASKGCVRNEKRPKPCALRRRLDG